ncbi:exodeoxyribonuclease V beta subunit [Natronospira proteinivora]|uniref:RecBCD enzyme subunit RecB n=1 Tax=Natronospira proteinivora TaxID=1807133 RepID=A0ABT1G8K8_9GAMM|nr:exodeoxyribonuclease V subunit beta [Natronospira proteinivora]MCP1727629.1 exodeoxyribonuclease V beta subunit [Natronospira proteinivora]
MSQGVLDPLKIGLSGRHLIEASAGTGKTYTLTALYVRLVLGHCGPDDADERRALLPPEILVVTFTEAATKELRDRIRARLAEAADCFLGRAEADPNDQFLTGLLAAYQDEEGRLKHGHHLQAAAEWMDEAAIYTIHGFCNRMLRQHAFDSGSPFDLELTQEQDRLTRLALEDYWREHFYGMDRTTLLGLSVLLNGDPANGEAVKPADLESFAGTVGKAIGHSAHLDQAPPEKLFEQLKKRSKTWQSAMEHFRQQVADHLEDLNEALEAAWKTKTLKGNARPTPKTWRGKMLPALREWIQRPTLGSPPCDVSPWQQLTLETLEKATKKDADTPSEILDNPVIAASDRLVEASEQLQMARSALLAQACGWIEKRLKQFKQQQSVIGFDDMLNDLHEALEGGNGERLAATIREHFPVALVDEFQDTDPVQYGIFRAIYGKDNGSEDSSWFLIGDPKQAIYSFRGADLETYLKAREESTNFIHTLGKNFRSSVAMVEAVNHLFQHAQSMPGGPFSREDLIYRDVDYKGRKERLVIDGEEAAAMNFWLLEKTRDDIGVVSIPKTEYRDTMAEVCASEISHLLWQAEQDEAGFDHPDGFQAIRPSDIAILVRTGQEASLVREALRKRGLRSVYLSDRENIFSSEEALDVLRWLKAAAEPESENLVRAALGTAALGHGWDTLHELVQNDARWEQELERFWRYGETWQAIGVLPMLRQLMREHQLTARLLKTEGGERQLTNLLHLSELLQEAAAHLDGAQALIRWLDEQIHDSGQGETGDEQLIRLESDAELIKVITIHKSKGLEYPLVFLPFPCAYRKESGQNPPLWYYKGGQRHLSFEPDEEIIEEAEALRFQEDLRLLYVALTRARHACWVGMAGVREQAADPRTKDPEKLQKSDLEHAAIGHLIRWQPGAPALDLRDRLDEIVIGHEPTHIIRADSHPPDAFLLTEEAGAPSMAMPRHYAGQPPNAERWWIASYSALLEDGPRAWAPGSADEDVIVEESLAEEVEDVEPEPDSLHAFPRGPAAGTFLHGLLEALAGQGFPAVGEPAFRELLYERLNTRRWRQWGQSLEAWVAATVESPLPLMESKARLADLEPGQYIPELEFMFSVNAVNAGEIDAIIRRHALPEAGRPQLGQNDLNGMLKGFIDLVVEHEGRFYVIDYKSNYLGPSDAAYSQSALKQAVVKKRYDAQYSLYLLALHRLLKARLGEDYDYDRHVGGAGCLFLRGVNHESRGLHLERPPRALVDELDALFSREVAHA